jgi:muramoyltetrapeptide carboxypeptidase
MTATLPNQPAESELPAAQETPAVVQQPKLIKPRCLKKGDTVGIIAPASPPFDPGIVEITYHWLEKLGLKYKLGKHIFDSYSDYAGTDEARLEDLHSMWADPNIDAVMPIRGGNGTVRLLPNLDFELIKKNPKIFIGFSDITGLLIPITQQTGLVTFHGPMLASFYESPYTYYYWRKAMMTPKPMGLITDPEQKEIWDPPYPPPRLVIAKGSGRGRLTGGCMTLVRQLEGTPWSMQTEGKIVFLEDLHEEPHNIDRVLTQLLLAGKLQKAAGIVIGECANCSPGDSRRRVLKLNYSLECVLRERLGNLGIPVVYGLKIGHTLDRLTLPLGMMASLEVSDRSGVKFKIEESATV